MSSEKKCCVPGCSGNSESQTTLHLFPNPGKDMDRFLSWVFNIGGDILALNNDYIYKNRRVCHNHFESKYCCRFNRISNIAVPTLNLPGLSTLKFTPSAERRSLRSIENLNEILPSTSKECSSLQIPVPQMNMSIPHTPMEKENIALQLLGPEHNMDISIPTLTVGRKNEKMSISPKNYSFSGVCQKDAVPIIHKASPASKKSKLTKTEQDLFKKLVGLKMKLSKCRNKSKKQATHLKSARRLLTNTQFIKALENMPSTGRVITLMQFRESKKKEKGRRFSQQEKIIALSIMKQSPKAYRLLRKMFILPSPQTLGTLLSQANIGPGINKNVFAQLKLKTEKMTIEDRLCVLLFDEMSIKPSVTYNSRKDAVTGFVTDGEQTRPIFADHAQVFMIRGLIRNYKQPVAYTFSSGATTGPELAKQIKTVIQRVQEAGFIVSATICDQGANNRSALKILTDEVKRKYLQRGEIPKENYNIFQVNEEDIITLYDPPHLLKGIRNNLLSKDLKFEINGVTKMAKWHHLELLMKENPAYKGIRLVPKLTENHIDQRRIGKMKVKYAAQVFSQTVASNMGYLADKGILPESCKDTADLLLFCDELFDSVNGSYANKKKHSKPLLQAVKPNSVHHKKWTEFMKILKTMKYCKKNSSVKVPSINNWVWTLDGIQILVKKLENVYNVTSVWMRHLNQDPLENFFGAIRSHGCRNVNPTPDIFQSAYAALLVNNLSSVHAPGANCQKDYCNALITLVANKDCEANTEHSIDLDKILKINILPLEQKCDPKVMAPLQYVSGYIIKKCKKIFKNCKTCKDNLIDDDEIEYIRYREYSNKRWLCSPTKAVIGLVSAFQDIITEELKENLEANNVGDYIKTLIYISVDFNFIKCDKHKGKLQQYMTNLSLRLFMFNYCKTLNKILSGKQDAIDDTDKYQIMAKNYSKKHCKRPHT